MTDSFATLNDVARLAGVSRMTVSNALNNSGRVSDGTRQRVLKAAEELGYVANFAARSLKGGRTNVLGMVVSDVSSPYFAEIVRGASAGSRRDDRELLISASPADNPAREQARVSLLSGGLSGGLLIVLPRSPSDYLRTLEKSRVPVVLINHRHDDTHLPTVSAENYHGARAATRHLAELGHRRVAFISGDPLSGQSLERLRGYRDALHEAGLPYAEDLVREGDFTQRRGFAATAELLDLPRPPTAIFTANDISAFGAIEAVKDRGLRVPDDVSVVGFDDIPTASQIHPALTTVRHPLYEIGEQAARLLVSLIEGRPVASRRLELQSALVVRDSTGPPP